MKPRKLYPTNDSSVICPDFCDPTCPSSCNSYSSDNYFNPPPSLPSPPPFYLSTSGQGRTFSPYIIVVVTALATILLFIGAYVVFVKNCSFWNRSRIPQGEEHQGHDHEFRDENRGPEVDHHIWYINTIGLQPSVINMITVFKYKKGEKLIEGTDCSVCLNEFQEDESLRLLPKCNHAFHVPCIDTWLRSHTNCPLCRAGIVSSSVTTPATSNSPSAENSGAGAGQVQAQTTNSGHDREMESNNQMRDGFHHQDHLETEIPGGPAGNERNFDEIMKLALILEEGSCIGDSGAKTSVEMKELRRSVSLSSSIQLNGTGPMMSDKENEKGLNLEQSEGDSSSGVKNVMRGASFLQKTSIPMKRSVSYGGGRSFFSRYCSSSNAVLPL